MIISKKKFNEAVEKAVNEAVAEEREKYKERVNEDWERRQRSRINDSIWKAIGENRKNLISVTKELNDVIAYLCDTNPDFAKKKIAKIKNKSSIYNIRYAGPLTENDIAPCSCYDDDTCEPVDPGDEF